MTVENLLLPFQFPFMQNAFWVVLLVAPPTALLSCFLVLKGWALMGDAVSHAVLPGVVLAWIVGIPLIVGAFAAGMSCALLTGYLSHNSRVKQDTVMGVVFSGMFAVGIILFTSIHTNQHLDHILFGNMLGIGTDDLWTSGLIGLAVSAVLLLKWKDFLLHAFDPAQAQASGLRTGLLHYGLLSILSLTIVATLSSVGLILAVALLVTPGAIAFLVVRSFGWMLFVAVAGLHRGHARRHLYELLPRQRAGADHRAGPQRRLHPRLPAPPLADAQQFAVDGRGRGNRLGKAVRALFDEGFAPRLQLERGLFILWRRLALAPAWSGVEAGHGVEIVAERRRGKVELRGSEDHRARQADTGGRRDRPAASRPD